MQFLCGKFISHTNSYHLTSFWPTDKNNSEKPVHRIEFYPNCVYFFFFRIPS